MKIKTIDRIVWGSVWNPGTVMDSVRGSVRDSVWDSVRDSVWESVGVSVRVSVGDWVTERNKEV